MRPDRSERKKNKHTKVLFKKSDLTVGRSSIFSDASQRYAKSAIFRMKRDLKQHEYYSDRGKLKRDLSLETDICVLRRYCRWKLMSLGAYSAKSKYSTYKGTDQETIEEFEDSSASGDNRPSEKSNIFNVDVTVLMMENLRNLLNIWMKKNLMDDSEMKQKFNNVLDSILHKLESKNSKDSSCSTYIFETDSKGLVLSTDKPSLICSDLCQICKKKKLLSSAKLQKYRKRHSVHSSEKATNPLRLISTLSIPRKFCRSESITMNEKDQKYKDPKRVEVHGPSDNMFVAPQKSTIVSVCTTTSTKNCFVLTENNNIKESNIHMLKIFPKLFCKSSSESKKDDKNKKLFDAMPSLVKSMYIDDLANITSTDANYVLESRKEEFTMTDVQKPILKTHNRNINTSTLKDKAVQKKKASICHSLEKKNVNAYKSKKAGCLRSALKSNLKNIKYKVPDTTNATTSLYARPKEDNITNIKKSNTVPATINVTQRQQRYRSNSPRLRDFCCKRSLRQRKRKRGLRKSSEKQLEEHVQRIIRYFFEYNGSQSIKFDVKINVCPFIDHDTKKSVNNIGDSKLTDNVAKESNEQSVINIDCQGYAPPTVLIYTENASDRYPAIIPLLDGAASHVKYMVDSKNSTTDNLLNNQERERDNVTSQDITELKTIVSNITHTTEKLVQEHLKRKTIKGRTKVESIRHPSSQSFTKVEDELRAVQKQSYLKVEAMQTAALNQSYTKLETNLPAVPKHSNTKFETKLSVVPKFDSKVKTLTKQINTKIDTKSQAIDKPSHFNVEIKEVQTTGKASSNSSEAKILNVPNRLLKAETQAKGIQISIETRSPETGFSGLKFNKEARKSDTLRYKPIKKSVSYAIIESEAILKVTDMTVGEESEKKPSKLKSQSLGNLNTTFQIPKSNNKQKIITFYCDECSKKYKCVYNCDRSVVETKTNLQDPPETNNADLYSGNHAMRFIENYYELSNGIYPKAKVEHEPLKPCKLNLRFTPCLLKVLLYCIFLSVLVIVIGGLIYFYVMHPSDVHNAINFLRVPRSPNPSPFEKSSTPVIMPSRSLSAGKRKFRTNIKSPGFQWFAAELGF